MATESKTKNTKYLVNGKWLTEEQYLKIPEKEWEKIEKKRKNIIK